MPRTPLGRHDGVSVGYRRPEISPMRSVLVAVLVPDPVLWAFQSLLIASLWD